MTGKLNSRARTPDWHSVSTKLTPTEFAFGHGDEYDTFIKEHCGRGDWAINGEYIGPVAVSIGPVTVTISSNPMTIFDPRDDPKEAFMVYYFEDAADAIVFKMKVCE